MVNSHRGSLTNGSETRKDKIRGRVAGPSYPCMGQDEVDEWVQVRPNTLCKIWFAIQPGMKMCVPFHFLFHSSFSASVSVVCVAPCVWALTKFAVAGSGDDLCQARPGVVAQRGLVLHLL